MTAPSRISVASTASGNPGVCGWNAILERPPPARLLDEDIRCDWLVIGAGFAGIAAARRLTQLHPHDRIVMVDALRVGEGAAGRSSGFMIDLPHDLSSDDYAGSIDRDRRQTAMNRTALDLAREAADEFGMGREILDARGKLNVAVTEKGAAHNRDYLTHLEAMGEPATWLDSADVAEIFGTSYFTSGLHTPGTIMLQPAAYLRAMADGLARRIDVYERTPVTSMHRTARTWTVRTPKATIEAPVVILAVNGHLESFGFLRRRLMHVFLFASMTRPLTAEEDRLLGGRQEWEAVPADPMGSTLRKVATPTGPRILVRNVFRFQSSLEARDRTVDRAAPHHDAGFWRRFPMLTGVDMEYRWGGRLCLSFNGVQVVGEVDEGLFSACCQNGLGASKGTLAGMLAVELASGVPNPYLDDLVDQPPPTRIPPDPFSFVGANAYLRWREWRAGAER